MTLKKDLTEKRFGKLTAKYVHSRSRNGHIRWVCECDCGNFHQVMSTHLSSGKIKHCGCDKKNSTEVDQWNGFGNISGNYWNSLQRGANGSKGRRILEFSITKEFAWELYLSQNGKCILSGVDIKFMHDNGTKVRNYRTVSLDRIDSSLGYIEGNVQWVHKDLNLMKGRLHENVFKDWCKLVVDNI